MEDNLSQLNPIEIEIISENNVTLKKKSEYNLNAKYNFSFVSFWFGG